MSQVYQMKIRWRGKLYSLADVLRTLSYEALLSRPLNDAQADIMAAQSERIIGRSLTTRWLMRPEPTASAWWVGPEVAF